jgi:bilirubin oxidase
MQKNLLATTVGLALTVLLSAYASAQPFSSPMPIPDTLSDRTNDPIRLSMDMTKKKFFNQVTSDTLGAADSVLGWPHPDLFVAQDTMPVETYSFNSPNLDTLGILGPTLILYKGDSVWFSITNNLMDPATVHWHGGHVPAWTDGGPHQTILPGATWKPFWKVMDQASTMWYHPHLHMETQEQVQKGLVGMMIIRDPDDPFEKQLPHTYGKDEFPVILQDKEFDRNTLTKSNTINTTCSMGPTFLANGTYRPYLNVPDQMARFRILNGSSERSFVLRITKGTPTDSNSIPFKIIATDGGYLAAPLTQTSLFIGGSERYEIVVDMKNHLGDTLYLMNFPTELPVSAAGGPNWDNPNCYVANNGNLDSFPQPLIQLRVRHDSSIDPAITSIPAAFRPLNIPDPAKADVIRYKHLYFTRDTTGAGPGPPFQIDNEPFKMEVINDTVLLGNTEIWEIINTSTVAHPFHIHDVDFFIISINGDTNVPAYLRGPKDVVMVQDDQVIRFVTKFEDFATKLVADSSYMYHCHILAHEDHGMMHQFVVVRPEELAVKASPPQADEWSLFPNPSAGNLSIIGKCAEVSTIRIYDLLGAKHGEILLPPVAGTYELSMPTLPAGVWTLEWSRPGAVSVKRVIIK